MEQDEKKQIIVPYDEYMELKRKADSHSVFITTTIKLDRDGICDLMIERADSECERQEDVDNWMKSLMGNSSLNKTSASAITSKGLIITKIRIVVFHVSIHNFMIKSQD